MKSQRGMGVIEAMVGLGIMTIAILGLNGLAISMIRGNLSAQLIDRATRLAQQQIEQVKRAGYTNATLGTTAEVNLTAAGNPGGTFLRTTVIAAGPLPTTRTITVTVGWADHGSRQLSVVTEIGK